MAQPLHATAKELLERTRRLAGHCEPPRLARAAMLGFVDFARERRTGECQNPSSPGYRASCELAGDLQPLCDHPDGIGRLWQAINQPMLQRAFAAAGKGTRKFTPAEIPAVTQLFTPSFVIRMLLEQTLVPIWNDMHGLSGRAQVLPVTKTLARELRILDPACGTMNFGLVAIDLLRAMYRQELDCAGTPGWPAEPSVRSAAEIDDAILRHNLFGVEIDAFTLELARHTLEAKLGKPIAPQQLNLTCGDALFDRRLRAEFDVVVTNPPYLSARNVSTALAKRWKQRYPLGARDAYACFIDRSLQLVRPGGRVGLLTMQSFMFTGSYEPLRRSLADRAAIERIVHFGPALFETGNPGTLQTVAFTLRREENPQQRADQIIYAERRVDQPDKEQPAAPGVELTQREMMQSPRGAWTYWLSPAERRVFATHRKLGEIAPPRQGLATTDNARFVRGWWEVEPFSDDPTCRATPGRWMPYVKAGQNRRWHESPRHRVNWQDDGREIKQAIVDKYPYLRGKWEWVAKNASYYGRRGVTYSYLTSGQFSARLLEAGAIFDVAGSSLFPDDPLAILAVLNSSVGRRLLDAINPTVNFQVGDLTELPLPVVVSESIREKVVRLLVLQRQLDAADEAAPEFVSPLPWRSAARQWTATQREMAVLEAALDREMADLYGLPIEATPVVRPSFDPEESARRQISFALKQVMQSREWSLIDTALVSDVRDHLQDAAAAIERQVGDLETFLRTEFAGWHTRLYRSRPPWWIFGDRMTQVIVAHDRADRPVLLQALRAAGQSPPAGWRRWVDDGIAVNLSPLRQALVDRTLKRSLDEIATSKSLLWSQTYRRPAATQVRMELRMRSCSASSASGDRARRSITQVNSAPIRN